MRRNTKVPDRLAHALKLCKERELEGGSVYVIQCNEFVKVGFAFDVYTRLGYLQVGCPYKLILLAIKSSMTPDILEDEIHASIEQYRERGEWFKLPPEVLTDLLRRL